MTTKEALAYVRGCFGSNPHKKLGLALDALEKHIEATTPWLPPQQEGFGPWIEYRVGDPGPREFEIAARLTKDERESRDYDHAPAQALDLCWVDSTVAYCVKLPETE